MISLSLFKQHAHIDDDIVDGDELLQQYLDAALLRAERYMDRKVYETEVPDTDATGVVLEADITQAVIMFAAHLYANRETVVIGTITAELPQGFKYLLMPYRILGV